jgi:hypothetical protein
MVERFFSSVVSIIRLFLEGGNVGDGGGNKKWYGNNRHKSKKSATGC